MSARKLLRYLESRVRRLLLGSHPYNTIFNYNWVNVRPMVRTFRNFGDIFQGRVADLGAGASPYYDLIALVNAIAYLLDMILPFNRTPVNFILVAVKEQG